MRENGAAPLRKERKKKCGMAKSKTALNYTVDGFWVVWWFVWTLPWRLFWYFLWGLAVIARTFLALLAALLSFGIIALVLIFVGSLLLPVQAEQDKFYAAAEDLGEAIEDVANTLIDLVQVLLDCKESLVEFWNTVWRFVAAIIHEVYEALDDIFNFGLDKDLFYWARSAAQLERELQREANLNRLRELSQLFENEITNRTKTIDPRHRGLYLEAMRRKMHKMARAQVIGNNVVESTARLLNIPQVICDIIETVFDFLINLIDLIDDFVLGFLSALLSVFDVIDGEFDESFLEAFVKFIIIEILLQIPFTGCFVNPDDLENAAVEDIPDLILDQVASRLISCLCGFRYENALGIPCVLSGNYPNDCDVVPNNIGAAIVGCFCFIPSVEFDEDTDPIDALIRCLGIDVLIAAFESFVDLLKSVYEPAIEWLKSVYNGAINQIKDIIDDIKDFFRGAEIIIETHVRMQGNDLIADTGRAVLEKFKRGLNRLEEWHTAAASLEEPALFQIIRDSVKRRDFAREFAQEYQNQMNATYVAEMHKKAGYKPLSEALMPFAMTIRAATMRMRENMGNMTEAFEPTRLKRTLQMRYAAMLEKLPESSGVKQFRKHFEELYGEESRQDVSNIVSVLRGVTKVGSWALGRHPRSREMHAAVKKEFNMTAAVKSVYALARKVRARRDQEDPENSRRSKTLEVIGKVWINAAGRTENLPLTVKYLEQKYGKDSPEVRTGVTQGIRSLPAGLVDQQHPKLREVMTRYGLTVEDLKQEHKEKRKENKKKEEEQTQFEQWLFDVKTHLDTEWTMYQDAVTQAWNEEYAEDSMPGKRVIVVAIAVGGGGAAALISVAGFALGAGLAIAATLLVAVLAPLLILLVLFLFTILQFVMHVGSGIINNTFRAEEDPASFDIVTPIILVLVDIVALSYTEGYSLSSLQGAIVDIGNILLDDLEYTGAWLLRDFACNIPLKIPPYTCPRYPLVDDIGRPVESIPDYIFNAWLFFPQDEPCLDSDWCGGGDCVCPENPSRLGTPSQPCFGQGYCNGWPLIRERIGIQNLEVDIDLTPNCNDVLRINHQKLRYYDDPDFKKLGFSFSWLTSPGFREFIFELLNIGKEILRFAIKRLLIGGYIRWSGAFSGVAGALWFIPAAPLQAIAVLTIGGNTLTETLNDVGVYVLKTATENRDLPVVGPWLYELTFWGRFENWQEKPPFGEPTAAQWLCVIGNIPSFFIFAGVVIALVGAALGFLLGGGICWIIFFFIDIVLFPLNLLWLLIRIQYVNTVLHRRRIFMEQFFNGSMSRGAASPARIGGSYAGKKNRRERRAWVRHSYSTRRMSLFDVVQHHRDSEDLRELSSLQHPLQRMNLQPSGPSFEVDGIVIFGKGRADGSSGSSSRHAHAEGGFSAATSLGGVGMAEHFASASRPSKRREEEKPEGFWNTLKAKAKGFFTQHAAPWTVAFGKGLVCTTMAMPTVWHPRSVKKIWDHSPFKTRTMFDRSRPAQRVAQEENAHKSEYVVYDELVPDSALGDIPLARYIFDPNGNNILEHPDYLVMSSSLQPKYILHDEAMASYVPLGRSVDLQRAQR